MCVGPAGQGGEWLLLLLLCMGLLECFPAGRVVACVIDSVIIDEQYYTLDSVSYVLDFLVSQTTSPYLSSLFSEDSTILVSALGDNDDEGLLDLGVAGLLQ